MIIANLTSIDAPRVTLVFLPLPLNLSLPLITGLTVLGATLSVSDGIWTGATGYTYQWLRNGAPISGATGMTYNLVLADVGTLISARVTATNASGPTSVTSLPTIAILLS